MSAFWVRADVIAARIGVGDLAGQVEPGMIITGVESLVGLLHDHLVSLLHFPLYIKSSGA